MKTLKETQIKVGNKLAYIDAEDFEKVSKYSWSLHVFGYAKTTTGKRPNRTTLSMHRLIMGSPKGLSIDHIDHNPLNNRKENLRICTKGQNLFNQLPGKRNTSGVVGVGWDKRLEKWEANIWTSGKSKHLGYFDTIEEAKKARLEAESKYFGGFANLNRYV